MHNLKILSEVISNTSTYKKLEVRSKCSVCHEKSNDHTIPVHYNAIKPRLTVFSNYSFLNLTLRSQYIQVRKLFKGGNYSKAILSAEIRYIFFTLFFSAVNITDN